ncbi:hypothetical protein [Streptomyces sp. B6B3]|uniref:hypothetical protein n=1 Tax=Streptomyces sp. B6B3 TaxID=3153570 RepID=UPI00325EF3F9
MDGLGQQIGDPTVTGDGDVEPFVPGAHPAPIQFHPTGLDVVEVGHDRPCLRHCLLAAVQLPDEGLARVLLVLGGRPAHPRHAHFTAQQCGGSAERRDRKV